MFESVLEARAQLALDAHRREAVREEPLAQLAQGEFGLEEGLRHLRGGHKVGAGGRRGGGGEGGRGGGGGRRERGARLGLGNLADPGGRRRGKEVV